MTYSTLEPTLIEDDEDDTILPGDLGVEFDESNPLDVLFFTRTYLAGTLLS